MRQSFGIGKGVMMGAGLLAFLLLPARSVAQTSAPAPLDVLSTRPDASVKLPAFAVVSIRANATPEGPTQIAFTNTGYSTLNIPMRTVIASAYGVRVDQVVGGPDWLDQQTFTIQAKVEDQDVPVLRHLSGAQRRSMILPVITDRLHLKAHEETRAETVAELRVAKTGTKLQDVALATSDVHEGDKPQPAGPPGTMTVGSRMFNGVSLPMSTLVRQLSNYLHMSVEDQTGLTGKYDVALNWEKEMATDSTEPDDMRAALQQALQQQLGLTLVEKKGLGKVIRIDEISKPTDN